MSGLIASPGAGEAVGARWALGALLLGPQAAATEGYAAVPGVLLLGVTMLVAGYTCGDLKQLSKILPPSKTSRGRRERNLRSFADFLSVWMWFLSHLVAVGVCARVLSATADHVTAGRIRRWLFGYETRALGEPWPDVMGVTVVLVICAMFMCGLEESMMFELMLLTALYAFSQVFTIFGLLNFDYANLNLPAPISGYQIFAAGAPISYTFSVLFTSAEPVKRRKRALLVIGVPLLVLTALCFLFTNVLKGNTVDVALPVTTLLEALAAGWLCPLLACVTVAGVALALTELCPALFAVLVALASPEWKVLTRSMTYESAATGSPVLAVFTAGSLAAILAFACPLAHMITLLNASHLLGVLLQALQLTVMRCVPTREQRDTGDIEYKRLATSQGEPSGRAEVARKPGLWFLPRGLRHTKTLDSIKSKVVKGCEERECLLLDEYGGARGSAGEGAKHEDERAELSDAASGASSGDDSTDIDAVVKEYRDTVKVVTSFPESSGEAARPPTARGARLAAAAAALSCAGAALAAAGLCVQHLSGVFYAVAVPVWTSGAVLAASQPGHRLDSWPLLRVEGPLVLLLSVLFLTPLLLDSWPAILLFAGAGVVIYARCDRWCGDLAIQRVRRASDRHKLHPAAAANAAASSLARLDTLYIPR